MIPEAHFERFETPKYRSRNPVQRLLIQRFGARIEALVEGCQPKRVLEVGVGEGFLSGYLASRLPQTTFVGVDANGEDIRRLRRSFPTIEAHVGNVYDLEPFRAEVPFDLVLCAEVLEHLAHPMDALDQIHALAPRRVVVSVPHEPFFMMSNLLRGKNLTRLGNDIDHRNHWGRRSLRQLLEQRFEVLALDTSYPWLIALLEPRRVRACRDLVA